MHYKRVWCVYTLMHTTQSLGKSWSNQMEMHAHPCRNTANFLSRHAWHDHVKKTDIRTKTSRSVIPLPVVFWKWGERKQGNLNKVQKCKPNLHLTSMIAENQVDYHFIWYEDHSLYNLNVEVQGRRFGFNISREILTSNYWDATCFWKQSETACYISSVVLV